MERRIITTNSNGVQLKKNGTFYAILKPGKDTNHVYHVGKRDYIMKKWRENFQNK